MKIRVYSDMHLDHYAGWFHETRLYDANNRAEPPMWVPPVLPDEKETILCLVGDLWFGTNWIEYGGYSWITPLANRFKQILVVLGNHDYWPQGQLTITSGGDKCNAKLQDMGLGNVHVLDSHTFAVDNWIFVGCTLWTDMDNMSPLAMHNMPNFMSYDGKIAYETGANGGWSRFTSQKWVDLHCKHRKYIETVVRSNKDKNIIVLTHHLPLNNLSDPKYRGDASNAYYSSDCSEIILDNDNIRFWAFGHSHHTVTDTLNNCMLVNNSVGYQGEHKEQIGLVAHRTFEL
jgi:predicted MPP superfamily phosphohydrolase